MGNKPVANAGKTLKAAFRWLAMLAGLAAGCGEYSETLSISEDGKARASVEMLLPRMTTFAEGGPRKAPDKKEDGGTIPHDILSVASVEIKAEIARFGAKAESLSDAIERDGRKIRGEFDLGSLLEGANEGEESVEPAAQGGGRRHEARPVVVFRGEDEMIYRRSIPASYFQEIVRMGWRWNIKYPATLKLPWTFTLKLPGQPIPEETNGRIESDGTISWRFDISDLLKNGAEMRAACRISPPEAVLPAIVPWAAGFLMFFVALLAAGLYGLKRCLAMAQETGTPPEFPV